MAHSRNQEEAKVIYATIPQMHASTWHDKSCVITTIDIFDKVKNAIFSIYYSIQ